MDGLSTLAACVGVSPAAVRKELRPAFREATADDMFGRGLLIVGQVADRWGVCSLSVGKAVWCELDVVRQVPAHYLGVCAPPPHSRTTMAEPLRTLVDGVEVEVPDSIPDIRASLPEVLREKFDWAAVERMRQRVVEGKIDLSVIEKSPD